MELNLLFHNIGFTLGTIVALVMAAFVYFKDRKSVTNITFGLSFLSIAVFCGSHVIGVNITDPYLSRAVLMGNISVIWITCFLAHCSFAVAGVLKQQRLFLIGTYTAAFFLSMIYILVPYTYLLPSIPKMYFPNYYVAGPLQWIMRVIFDIIVPGYFMGILIYAYYKADMILRNRLKYFFVAMVVGYSIGSIAILLVYDIQVDPLWASFFVPILAVPMAYAIVRYNLMDIRVIAKRAFTFGIIITSASFGIFIIGYVNYSLTLLIPNFPVWIMPLVGGLIATILGVVVWNKFRESDQLKYEFITTVTHKLRTPLTSIKWSIENISTVVPEANKIDLSHMKESAEKLVQLTDVLARTSSEDAGEYLYKWEPINMNDLCKESFDEHHQKAIDSGIQMDFKPSSEPAKIKGDKTRLQSVLDIMLDNAVAYSKKSGHVAVSITSNDGEVTLNVTDDGIGMDKNESKLIFSRFYRTNMARSADTEGLGIGLFLAKEIVERHGGKMKSFSEGSGKGSTFSIVLPMV